MELHSSPSGHLQNKLGEEVRIEPDYIFPLLKCTDLANSRTKPARYVIVTQRRVGDDTAAIAAKAPQTWRYLDSHRRLFEARKSSIYSHGIPFALFGIGDYSFAPWKVGVSGLHRTPRFALVGPVEKKPVLFDDTCYFLPFENEHEARVVAEILNSQECQEFLAALTFTDSKRPITVELLQRLNIGALAEDAGLAEELSACRNHSPPYPKRPDAMQAELVMDRPSSRKVR